MKKTLIALVILVAGCCLSGCGPTLYHVNVNGYTDPAAPTQLAPGGSFFVIENQQAQNPLLEKEIAGKINKLLTNKGYDAGPLRPGPVLPVLLLRRRAGTRRQRGHAGLLHLLRLRPRGRHRLARQPLCVWRALLLLLPRPGEPLRPLAADQCGGRQILSGNKGQFQTVWVGEARSTGASTDMRLAINYLLLADFQQFGQNTGKAVGVEINERRPAGAGVDQMSSEFRVFSF